MIAIRDEVVSFFRRRPWARTAAWALLATVAAVTALVLGFLLGLARPRRQSSR